MNELDTTSNTKKQARSKIIPEQMTPLIEGENLSNITITNGSETIKISDLITNHLIIVLVSNTCSACEETLETIYEYINLHKYTNILLLVNTDLNAYNKLLHIFGDKLRIMNIPLETMLQIFKTTFLPLGFALNSEGIIRATHAFNNIEIFNELIDPLQISTSGNDK